MGEPGSGRADPFDPDRWALRPDGVTPAPVTVPKDRVSRPDRYLKGPIPWRWLVRAMLLPGKALAVGIMLWQLRGMTGRNPVLFCQARAVDEGIPTTTARRAIRTLAAANLIAIHNRPGRGLEVTILDIPGNKRSGATERR